MACYEKGLSGVGSDHQYTNSIGEGWSCFDLGLAVENLCLSAYDKGLGTLIMGMRDEQAIQTLLNIPEQYEVVALIALGHPDMDPPMPARKKVEEVTVFLDK
ncbi:nitroreductase family protein [gut metagenome]|uniref:Nitroreductase family protein n=1 Tax=gut metagenome TaxID=749906 RepID=J9GKM8_9ZZZZ